MCYTIRHSRALFRADTVATTHRRDRGECLIVFPQVRSRRAVALLGLCQAGVRGTERGCSEGKPSLEEYINSGILLHDTQPSGKVA